MCDGRQADGLSPRTCPACLLSNLKRMQGLTSQTKVQARAARERLKEVLQRREQVGNLRDSSRIKRRLRALQDECSATRDYIFERRIDAADVRFRTMEVAQCIQEAWYKMTDHYQKLLMEEGQVQMTLQNELAMHVAELAKLRREKVLQAISLFQVDLDCDVAHIQGLPLPRYLHSFNSGGSAGERLAMTQLARITAVIAEILNIEIPFRLDFRPSHCNILGSTSSGRQRVFALSPSSPAAEYSSTTTITFAAAAGVEPSLPTNTWSRDYRQALHLLSLDVRHLMLTQLEAGTDEEASYRRICATNDISPSITLRNLLALTSMTRLGYGENRSCEVCLPICCCVACYHVAEGRGRGRGG